MNSIQNYISTVTAIKDAILRSRYRAAAFVNKEMLSLYYGIGEYVSANSREGYWGKSAIEQISELLQKELPGLRGFSASNIKNMRLFYEEWSPIINRQPLAGETYSESKTPSKSLYVDENCLLSAIRQPTVGELDMENFMRIGFTHHIEILSKAKTLNERLFYVNECAINFWSKYTLKSQLKANLYGKRGSMPNNFGHTLPTKEQAILAIRSFRDEYLLDYINIEPIGEKDSDVDERVLEHNIVANIKNFIMTFGKDFSFIGNQYRIEVDGEESFIDLLFFNRDLNCLVAVELKSGKFKPSYLGQLTYYLSALDELVRKSHEQPSIGIILCKEMNNTVVEFAIRDYNKPMGVATYRTQNDMPEKFRRALPNMDELKKIL